MSQEEEIEKGFQQHFASITTEKKPDKKVQLRMFRNAGIDPNAPIDGTGIDANLQKELEKPKSLHEILSDAKRNYTETTGKPAGGGKKRRKTKRKRSKKSRVLQLRKKSYSKRKAK